MSLGLCEVEKERGKSAALHLHLGVLSAGCSGTADRVALFAASAAAARAGTACRNGSPRALPLGRRSSRWPMARGRISGKGYIWARCCHLSPEDRKTLFPPRSIHLCVQVGRTEKPICKVKHQYSKCCSYRWNGSISVEGQLHNQQFCLCPFVSPGWTHKKAVELLLSFTRPYLTEGPH